MRVSTQGCFCRANWSSFGFRRTCPSSLEAGFNTSHVPAFDTAKVLFDRYWDAKRQSVMDQVTTSQDRWMEVIETLCDEITSVQQLSVAKEKVDSFSPDYLKQMASEGVLTFDGRRYGFGHESFFDYCFARLFFNRPESLGSFLEKSEQHLFRRAQVRQVLAYLRDASPALSPHLVLDNVRVPRPSRRADCRDMLTIKHRYELNFINSGPV